MKRILAVIVLLAMVLVGCANEMPQSYVPTGDGLSYDDDYTGPTATQAPEVSDQTLTLTYYPEKSLNPFQCTDFTNRVLFGLIYQSLFTVDRSYKMQPLLCEKYSMSQDMRTYTFYIDKAATFSDGTPVKAEDVAASLLAAWESPYYKGRFQHFLSIELTGNNGVTVNLITPYENLPILLDIPVVKKTQVEADRPLGSGPYVLEPGPSALRLRKRTDWWCTGDLTVTAPVIELLKAESTTQIRDNFQFSGLNMVCADPGSDRYTDYRCDFELWDCETGMFVYLAVNEESDVFKLEGLREGLTYAIDRETLAKTYYRGFGIPANLPASPSSPYYSEVLAARYAYDPVRYAQSVSQHLLPEDAAVFLVNSDDSLRVRMARHIADMLRECGLRVDMKELSGNDYLYALQMKEFDLYLGQTKLSANMDLSAFFAATGTLSYGAVDDVGAYALCLQSLENHGNYFTLHQTVMDQGLLCPILFYNYAIYATRGTLIGMTPTRDNIFYYSVGKTMEGAFIRN